MGSVISDVRLTTPEDVIGVIPALLGFHPTESVVIIGLAGPRRRVCLTMRADLPPPGESPGVELARRLATRLFRAGAQSAMLVVFTRQPAGSRSDPEKGRALPYASFVASLDRELHGKGVECLDLLLTGAGRIWSYLCRDDSCCPATGIVVPTALTSAAARLHAEIVGRGGHVWESRRELARSVAPPTGALAGELENVYEVASDTLLDRLAAVGVDQVRAETVALTRLLHRQYVDGLERLTPVQAARLALGMADVVARDEILSGGGQPEPDALQALLGDAVRLALPPGDAPVCLALAWVSYQAGNGALARCALDRAVRSDPESALGQLLSQALEMALPPHRLAQASAGGLGGDGSATNADAG